MLKHRDLNIWAFIAIPFQLAFALWLFSFGTTYMYVLGLVILACSHYQSFSIGVIAECQRSLERIDALAKKQEEIMRTWWMK